jgi:Tfp pilus assembly protein PilF
MFKKAIRFDPKNATYFNNKGACLNEMNKYKQAIVCFDKSIQIDYA